MLIKKCIEICGAEYKEAIMSIFKASQSHRVIVQGKADFSICAEVVIMQARKAEKLEGFQDKLW